MENEKLGDITVEEDTDGKAVWVFEGKIKTDVPLETEADTVVEAINELAGKLQDGGGGDDENYSFMNDPDWKLFEDTPEPASNQLIFSIRIIDPSYRTAGNYYEEYTNNGGTYFPVTESRVECNLRIELPNYIETSYNIREYTPYKIEWGDGSVSSHSGGVSDAGIPYGYDGYGGGGASTAASHVYTEAGTYIVTCTLGLTYPLSGIKAGAYRIRVHSQNNATVYQANAPITVFAKVGKGFSCYAGTSGSYYRQPLGQIAALGMNRTIKFLSGDFAKLGFLNFGSFNSLKYLKTDAIRFVYEYSHVSGSFIEKRVYDIPIANSYCLELLEVTGETYSGECSYIYTFAEDEKYLNFYTTNEITSDDDFPTYQGSFQNCYALKDLPSQILNLCAFGNNVFINCYSLKSIDMPECTTLGARAFSDCKALKKVSLPKLKDIPTNCFSGCTALANVNISKCVTIGDGAFSGCNLLSAIDFEKCETIGDYAIPSGSYSCLKRISLPKCTVINFTCQNSYMLSEINCPACTSITNDYAFQNCYGLCTVNVAENCTFGKYCFSGCYSLYPRPDGSVN